MELPQKISGEKIAFAAQQLYTKIRFPCVVIQEKKGVQKLGRKKGKKRKKKEKKKEQKLLSKFHVARPNRSQVISKSLKFRTR